MFEENDRVLFKAKSLFAVFVGLSAVLVFVLGITLTVTVYWAYLFIIPVGWFFCWVAWLIIKLFLSFLCDVKFIRNKLYGESNIGLIDIFKSYKEQIADLEEEEKQMDEIEAELARMQRLAEEGNIEEYQKSENNMLSNEEENNNSTF